jgi:hypothetical protein
LHINATRSPVSMPAPISPLASAVTSAANSRDVTSCQIPSTRRRIVTRSGKYVAFSNT